MLPFVSLLTPTYNRRLFIPQLLRNFWSQTYPPERMELVVLDDGDDPVDDLLQHVPGVCYIRIPEKLELGFKRNLITHYAQGDVLVHMDDDDFYPPTRVAHAVKMLTDSDRLLAGSSAMFIYEVQDKIIHRSGPFAPNHGTNGTLAYKRAYLDHNRFDDTTTLRDEALFTRGFTNPMVQLDPMQTILCISHGRNSWDKSKSTSKNQTDLKLKHFVKNEESLKFYRYTLPKQLAAKAKSSEQTPDDANEGTHAI